VSVRGVGSKQLWCVCACQEGARETWADGSPDWHLHCAYIELHPDYVNVFNTSELHDYGQDPK
jgi:hypothetical protein